MPEHSDVSMHVPPPEGVEQDPPDPDPDPDHPDPDPSPSPDPELPPFPDPLPPELSCAGLGSSVPVESLEEVIDPPLKVKHWLALPHAA